MLLTTETRFSFLRSRPSLSCNSRQWLFKVSVSSTLTPAMHVSVCSFGIDCDLILWTPSLGVMGETHTRGCLELGV